jgi:hypothetical protein
MRQPLDADKANWQVFADIFKGSSIYEWFEPQINGL